MSLDKSSFEQSLKGAESEGASGGANVASSLMGALKSTAVKLASTLAIGKTVSTAVTSAMDFQDGMAKMSTLFDTTKTDVYGLQTQFRELSDQTGKSATELAEAGYQALSAGQSVENVGEFVKTATNLAKAGFTDSTTAVDVLTTAMNAYGASAGTADEISNKLVRTQNLGKTTVGELASAMGKIIPTASGMNVNIDNLTSGYVSLTKQGIATAEATTYMNSMLNELGDSGSTLGGVLKDKTGKSFQELMASGMSLADVLKITKDYANESGTAYNELWSSAEAGKAGMAILNGGVQEFNDTVSVMASKTDDVSEALQKLETPQERIAKTSNALHNTLMTFGDMLVSSVTPALIVVTDGLSGMASQLSTIFEGSENISQAVESIFLLLTTKMNEMIQNGIPTEAYNMVTTLASGILDNVDYVLDAFTQFLSSAIDFIGTFAPQFLQIAMEFISQMVVGIIDRLPDFIASLSNLINNGVSYLMSNLPQFLQTGMQFLLKIASGIIQNIPAIVDALIRAVSSLISTIIANLPQFYAKGGELLGQMISGIFSMLGQLGQAGARIVSTIGQHLMNLPRQALQWGRDLISNFVSGIKSMIGSVVNAVSGVASKVKSFLHFSEPDEGPLADFHTYGPDMMKLFASGIEKNSGLLEEAFNDSLDFVKNPIDITTRAGITATTGSQSGTTNAYGGVTINVYGANDDEALAQKVMYLIQHESERKESVFA